VQLDGAPGDGQAQADAAAGAAAIGVDAVEGIEDPVQVSIGNSGAVVADAQLG